MSKTSHALQKLERSSVEVVGFSHAFSWETSSFCTVTINTCQMPFGPRFKEERAEKATELFRLHLERTGTMDALTGWLRKIVEVPVDKRPRDALEHLKKHWSPWNGNIVNTAIKNVMKDVQQELADVLEENEELKSKIAQLEVALLSRKVAALNAKSTKNLKESKAAKKSENNSVVRKLAEKKSSSETTSRPPFCGAPYYSNTATATSPAHTMCNPSFGGMLVPNVPFIPVVSGGASVMV